MIWDSLIICRYQTILEIVNKRYVRAGHWDVPLQATDSKAKEILLIMRKIEHLNSNSLEDI